MVTNLPYHISSPLFFKVLEYRDLFERLVLMFQKEFAERLLAHPGTKDYGIPSVFCRQYFEVSAVTPVSPDSFYPAPRVASKVLLIIPRKLPREAVADEKLFFRLVRGAFAQRRKTLPNSLRGAGFEEPDLAERIAAGGIDPQRRGETLNLEEFAALCRSFTRKSN
jgi:16S rRNA (adenine1518-N6/adenine1519-N6)-dimethyltransferase